MTRCLGSIPLLLCLVGCDSAERAPPKAGGAKTGDAKTEDVKTERAKADDAGAETPRSDGGAGADDAGAAEQPPETEPETPPPVGLTGSLTIEGTTIDLATEPLRYEGVHCTDGDGVQILVRRGEHGRPLWIRTELGRVRLGETVAPRTKSTTPAEAPVDVFGGVSVAGRAAEATLPDSGTVRFDALAAGGPVDVRFEVDFGTLGHAEGRILVETTTGEVCIRPPPPPRP